MFRRRELSHLIRAVNGRGNSLRILIGSQYKKAKEQLLIGNINFSNRLKLRHPKQDGIWYFRINQQYRALARYTNNEFHVFDIDTHQT